MMVVSYEGVFSKRGTLTKVPRVLLCCHGEFSKIDGSSRDDP